MEKPSFRARTLVDYLFSFEQGVNAGLPAIVLPKNQLARGHNTTVRGGFVTVRPPVKKLTLSFSPYSNAQTDFENGRYQGGCYYQPDNGTDSLMASISGHLFRCEITGNTAAISDVSIPGDLDDATRNQAWLIQAEKWVIKTDGTSKLPVFYNGTSSVRSLGETAITFTADVVTPFTVPAAGELVVANPITLSAPFTGQIGDLINVAPVGAFTVTAIAGATVSLSNFNALPVGAYIPAGNDVTWTAAGNQLPAGRMMAYGLGRVWITLTDGKQFSAGDLVGGSSGTVAENFRDAVLNITENSYLLGGGNFAVPGPYGSIRAMCFSETLDSSMGQGALQVFTPNVVFSCNAPVDRLTWQSLTNPILTESAKGGGGLGQWSTVNVNSDILSRSLDGDRSLILARREFNTWGNVPISREVQPQIDRDSESLLAHTSRVVFDNRSLLTSEGVLNDDHGIYFKRIIPINLEPVSSLSGKSPSVYDALYWDGLNVFQLIQGEFAGVQRCFAFTWNALEEKIEIWELLKSATTEIYDDVDTRIVWSFESYLDFGQKDPRVRDRLRLENGEIYIDELRGKVDFQAYYKPDSWPCWVPWFAWQECEGNTTDGKPGFRPNMGLGEPSPVPCDEINNRPLREGYGFHFKLVITGHCRFMGAKIGAVAVPQPEWAKPSCFPICDT